VGDEIESQTLALRVSERADDGALWLDTDGDVEATLEAEGTMPIPPYMQRPGDQLDVERYQTVFAQRMGSAAAPTAGLHLTGDMLAVIQARGIEIARVTLHVGVGTFRPVTTDDLDEHPMHSEHVEVDRVACAAIRGTRARGGRVVAIGTTAVRALESAKDESAAGHVVSTQRVTDLLIQPGYRFSVVDALLTNFHQPKSTLLALVSAFAGHERVLSAYSEAVERRYRFLSYGDCMWIPRSIGGDP
jgi:S-adenosylmethionine:tRNA ribosyltransferase-isomerase